MKSDHVPSHYKLGANSDSFNIFQKIPGTPSYYKLFRNETFARIEQRGKFDCFWTLSCGETQWPEVWAAILREEGYDIKYIDVTYNGTFEEILVDNILLSEFIEQKIPNVSTFMKDHFVLLTRMFDSRVKAFLTHILKKSGIESYSYRIEFQMRGMPHVHGIGWFDKSLVAKYKNPDGSFTEDVTKLVEEWVSVSLQNDDKELNDIVQKVQVHRHRKSCIKHKKISDQSTNKANKILLEENCRFGFPKPPSEKTIVADLTPDDLPKPELEIYENILRKAKQKLNNIQLEEEDMSLDEFLKSIDMEGQHDLYYKALKISRRGKLIILKRTVKERMVNNYVPNFLKAWRANLDFQICLDNYAVVTYITDYLTKTDMRLTQMLKKALKEYQGKNDFQMKNHLKKVFFTHRQQCVSESSYLLIPGLDLKGSSVKTKFIATGFPEERHGLIRKLLDQEEDADEEDAEEIEHKKTKGFKIEGREGTFVQSQSSIHDKYHVRPPVLYDMTLAEFAAKFESCSPSVIRDQKIEINQDRTSDMKGYLTAFGSEAELPKYIHLIDGSYMKLKEQPYILRIHVSKNKDPLHKVYAELILFYPWINEIDDLHRNNSTEMIKLFNNNRELIETNRQNIFPHSSTLDSLTGILENDNFERPILLYDTLDGEGQQQNEDDMEGMEPLDTAELPDEYDTLDNKAGSSSKEKVIMKRIDLTEKDIQVMYQHARSLSYAQKIVFDKFMHYIRCMVIQRNGGGLIEAKPPMIIVHGGKIKHI